MTPIVDMAATRPRPPFDRSFSNGLHALRGVAALSVFVNHFFDFLSHDSVVLSPLHWVDGGLSAVALFFVMSGTVLGISLKNFRPSAALYAGYMIKRAFRLLPMVVVSCSIGFLYTHTGATPAAGDIFGAEFYRFYHAPITVGQLLLSWTGLSAIANPPMWSIYVEIFASALLPLFVLCSHRLIGSAVLCTGLLVLSFAMTDVDGHFLHNHWPVYMVNFSVGLLLCHLGRFVSGIVNRLPSMVFGATVIALYLLLMNGRTMLGFGPDDAHGDAGSNLFDLTVSVALVLLLIERRAAGTRSSLSRFLGDISYPLYLLHWPVLCLLLAGSVRLLGAGWIAVHVELWTVSLFALSAPLLILLAWSCYRWLERPAIAAGKRLADRLSRRSPIETKEGFSGYGVVAVTNAETGHV